jgi:hypothetical protein
VVVVEVVGTLLLSTFVMDRFWWDQAKADETLLPVMRKLAEREVGRMHAGACGGLVQPA